MPKPCSFLHLGMLTDTVRARPASKRRIYRPCARPVSRDRGRSRAFCVPSRRLDSAPWRSHRSASRCKPLALGTVAPGPTHLIFLRALGARPESARSEYGPSKRSRRPPSLRLLNPSIWIVHTVYKTSGGCPSLTHRPPPPNIKSPRHVSGA